MHQLELENQALRDELTRLQQIVLAMQRSTYAVALQQQAVAVAPVAGQ